MSPRRERSPKWGAEWAATLPSLAWLALLFALPTAALFAIAFRPATPYGGIGPGATLDTLRALADPSYPALLARTLGYALATTAACLALALPAAYAIARAPRATRRALLLAVVVPFWTSFLVRVFAWKTLLHPDGPVKRALAALGLVPADGTLLYTPGAVLLVLVYTELPFAILPLYAAAEKFDFGLLEAACDLGATRWRAAWSVFVPGVRRGLAAAALVVFIPSLGAYVVPDLVGGPSSEMLGNKIAQRTFADRNLPHAAALAAGLATAVLVPAALAGTLRRRGEDA